MVVAPETVAAAIGIGAIVLAAVTVLVSLDEAGQRILRRLWAAGAGAALACVLVGILPVMYPLTSQMGLFVVFGILLVPLLHLIFAEKPESRTHRSMAGLFALTRTGFFSLLFGMAVAMLAARKPVVYFAAVAVALTLAPAASKVYELLHYEGVKKARAAMFVSVVAILPMIVVLVVGSSVLAALAEVAAPVVGLSCGAMIAMAIGESLADGLRKRSWIDLVLAVLGAVIVALVV